MKAPVKMIPNVTPTPDEIHMPVLAFYAGEWESEDEYARCIRPDRYVDMWVHPAGSDWGNPDSEYWQLACDEDGDECDPPDWYILSPVDAEAAA